MSFELIETVEVGAGGAASIEFTSIPQDGTDLVLKVSARGDANFGFDPALEINSETVGRDQLELFGDGSSVNTNSFSSASIDSIGLRRVLTTPDETANTFASIEIYFSNYTSTTTKSISVNSVTENNATQAFQYLEAANWQNSTGITQLVLDAPANFVEYSTASLYKITAA